MNELKSAMNEYELITPKGKQWVYADSYKNLEGTNTYEFYRENITGPVLTIEDVKSIKLVIKE